MAPFGSTARNKIGEHDRHKTTNPKYALARLQREREAIDARIAKLEGKEQEEDDPEDAADVREESHVARHLRETSGETWGGRGVDGPCVPTSERVAFHYIPGDLDSDFRGTSFARGKFADRHLACTITVQ